MKEPYLMTREEWYTEKEKTKVKHGQTNYTRSSKSEEIQRMARLEFLLFGVGEWIHNKACNGEGWAIEILENPIYDRYHMVIKKAKEEGFLNEKQRL